MSIGRLAIVALLALPVSAQAQSATGPTTVEVVSTGSIDLPASWFTIPVTFSVQAQKREAAEKLLEEKRQAVRAAMRTQGIAADALIVVPGSETVTEVPAIDLTVFEADEDEKPKDAEKKSEEELLTGASVSISSTATLKVATLDQAQALSQSLTSDEVKLGKPTAVLADPQAGRRQAKAKALAVAREDAAVYGRELGLRPGKVLRISEGGTQLLFPGIQQKFMDMFTAGPQAFQAMFTSANPTVVHVEETIVVEFAMVP